LSLLIKFGFAIKIHKERKKVVPNWFESSLLALSLKTTLTHRRSYREETKQPSNPYNKQHNVPARARRLHKMQSPHPHPPNLQILPVCVIEYDEGWQRAEIECNWCREKVGLPKHVMVDGWIQEREWIRRRKKSEKVETDKGGEKRDKEARAGDDILETSEGAPETLGDGEAEAGGRDWNG
jgi:hypothetical protein